MKQGNKLTVFFAYAREDSDLRSRLEKHLYTLKRKGVIQTWYDGMIDPGKVWEKEISLQLQKANIVLLLISVDFISSDYCYDIEMEKALERHDNKEAVIVPIILNHCDWEETPLANIQVLPEGGFPVLSDHWKNQDQALQNVARGVKSIVLGQIENRKKVLEDFKSVIEEQEHKILLLKKEMVDIEKLYNLKMPKAKLYYEIEDLKKAIVTKDSRINKLVEKNKNLEKRIAEMEEALVRDKSSKKGNDQKEGSGNNANEPIRNSESEKSKVQFSTLTSRGYMDEILDKVAKGGYEALTKNEKAFLFGDVRAQEKEEKTKTLLSSLKDFFGTS